LSVASEAGMADIADDDADDAYTDESHCDREGAVTYERKMPILCDESE